MLLREYGWNTERLIDKYMDSPTKVAVKAGIQRESSIGQQSVNSSSPVEPRRSTRRTTLPTPADSKFICSICCDDEPPAVLSLQCGHKYCSNCWASYIEGKVREEGECTIRCMESGCILLVPDSFIKENTSPKVYTRFEELVLRHYVSHIHNLKFCPAPGCTDTISCPAAATKSALSTIVPTVVCSQGHIFCFGCSIDSDHRPVLCGVARLWLKKCQDDSETANWIKTNTKECSKCQSTIEKNGGCK
jgi:ariadne-1